MRKLIIGMTIVLFCCGFSSAQQQSGTTGTVGENDTFLATNAQVANAVNIPLVVSGAPITVGASTTTFQAPNGFFSFGTMINRSIAFPRGGTIANLYVCIQSTQSATGALTITFYSGTWQGSMTAQALTVSIPASSVAGCYRDSVHSFSYTAGQGVVLQVVNAATATSAGLNDIYAEFTGAH